MRLRSLPRSVRVAGGMLVAVSVLIGTFFAPSAASAQTPVGDQSGIAQQADPSRVCIQIYPPPPGCPGSPPPTDPIQVRPSPSLPAVAPAARIYPGGHPATIARALRPGATVLITFRDDAGSILSGLTGYQCEAAWFEVLGPDGWTAVPSIMPTCTVLRFAPQAGAWPVAYVPAGPQPGIYRLLMQATHPASGQTLIVSDPFVVE